MSPFSILSNAPIWVWPLLGVLLVFGFIASRERTTIIIPLYFLPLLGILSFRAVSALSVDVFIWVIFALAYVFGTRQGFVFQRKIIQSKTKSHVTLSGEWITMIVVMVIFWMNFIGGAARAIAPHIYAATTFHVIFATIAGVTAGVFLGRALRLFRTPVQG